MKFGKFLKDIHIKRSYVSIFDFEAYFYKHISSVDLKTDSVENN